MASCKRYRLAEPVSVRELLLLDGALSARALLGCTLVRRYVDRETGELLREARARIVETEYYCVHDRASHSHGKRTARNSTMFAGVGVCYVYKIYGVHHCVNVTAGEPGSAILIRSLEPCYAHRPCVAQSAVTSGPGNLTKALSIDLALNGVNLLDPASVLHLRLGETATPARAIGDAAIDYSTAYPIVEQHLESVASPYSDRSTVVDEHDEASMQPALTPLTWQESEIVASSSRIGVKKDAFRQWRFFFRNNQFVSGKRS